MSSYNYGSSVRVKGTFKNASDVLTDPGTVTLRVRDAAGVVSTYTWAGGGVTKDSTGIFYRDITLSGTGEWVFWFVGASGVTAEGGGTMTVTPALT